MYIISLTILFCVCWMKAEVCNFSVTSVTKQIRINNHCLQTGFPTISQIDWLIQSCCVGLVVVLKQQSNVLYSTKIQMFHLWGIRPTICLLICRILNLFIIEKITHFNFKYECKPSRALLLYNVEIWNLFLYLQNKQEHLMTWRFVLYVTWNDLSKERKHQLLRFFF